MSASLKSAVTFIKTISPFPRTLFSRTTQCHKAATQMDSQRYRRRRRRPQPFAFSQKAKGMSYQRSELDSDNKAYLQELIEYKYQNSPLKEAPSERNRWTKQTSRAGVIAVKLGSYPLYYKNGRQVMCILFQIVDNHVLKYEPPEEFVNSRNYKPHWKLRFGGLTIGALSTDPYQYTEHYNKMFEEAGVPPKRKVAKFMVTPNAALQPGTPLTAMHFKVGQYIDVRARTIGHGFQGVVKRWGFKGGPASHGSSKFHRRPGAIGAGGKSITKGKKMPGRMGFKWRLKKGLQILRINTKYNVIYTSGNSCPGPNHCYTLIFDSALLNRRRQLEEAIEQDPDREPYMPTFYPDLDTPEGGFPEEINHESLHDMEDNTITYDVDTEERKKASS